MHAPVFQEENLVAEYLMTDGWHVKTMGRVAAFHRALQRNDVGDDLLRDEQPSGTRAAGV